MPYAGEPAQAGDGCEAPLTSQIPLTPSVCLIGSLCHLSRPDHGWLAVQVATTAAAIQCGPGMMLRQSAVQEHSLTGQHNVLLLQPKCTGHGGSNAAITP